ncbi:hypothetical protein [Azospirillum sp. B510]|uniref:hypothetical protein n=1 Tax=Azospirillum sp. (strain B510) TaxID=137722 RepID=UPI000B34A64A|nr:hypothetical protein [Azospirillum sp. B510]
MKAIQFSTGDIRSGKHLFQTVELPTPVPAPRDVLVAVKAVSINPVDTKVRSGLVGVPDDVTVLAGKIHEGWRV